MLNVKVHGSKIKKKTMYDMFGRVVRRKLLLFKKNMAARLRCTKLHLNQMRPKWRLGSGYV